MADLPTLDLKRAYRLLLLGLKVCQRNVSNLSRSPLRVLVGDLIGDFSVVASKRDKFVGLFVDALARDFGSTVRSTDLSVVGPSTAQVEKRILYWSQNGRAEWRVAPQSLFLQGNLVGLRQYMDQQGKEIDPFLKSRFLAWNLRDLSGLRSLALDTRVVNDQFDCQTELALWELHEGLPRFRVPKGRLTSAVGQAFSRSKEGTFNSWQESQIRQRRFQASTKLMRTAGINWAVGFEIIRAITLPKPFFDPFHELIWLHGLIRLMHRKSYSHLGQMTEEYFRQLALGLSNGVTDNPLTLIGSGAGEGEQGTSAWSRVALAARITKGLVSQLGPERLQTLLTPARRARRIGADERHLIAEQLRIQIGEVRGPLGKFLQAYLSLVCDPVENFEMLRRARSLNTGVPFSELRPTLDKEYGADLIELFSEIDPIPVGAGTVAQIHQAAVRGDGRRVALKILYPDIRDLIELDLNIAKTVRPILALFGPSTFTREVLGELSHALQAEVDLAQEAKNTFQFSEAFKNSRVCQLPRIEETICRQSVMAIELISAPTLSEVAASFEEKDRIRAASQFVKYCYLCFKKGLINSDVNPDNFFWRDNRIVPVDFGSVKVWTASEVSAVAPMLRWMRSGDPKDFDRAVLDMGLLKYSRPEHSRALREAIVSSGLSRIWEGRVHRITKAEVQASLSQLFGLFSKSLRYLQLQPQFLLGFRMVYLYLMTLAELDVELNFQHLMAEADSDEP